MEIDNRTFVEIYASYVPGEKMDVVRELADLCCVDSSTVRNWGLGNKRPHKISQNNIVKYLKKKGIRTTTQILFPY